MLDDAQKTAVRQWVADGAGLSEVQRRLKDEFGISMTYMDVRFLLLDLDAQVKDKPEPKPKAPPPASPASVAAPDGLPPEEAPEDEDFGAPVPDGDGYTPEGMDAPPVSKVSVSVDRVVRAGALASGSVTFSDGVTAGWAVDRFGRLSLSNVSKEGYQPSRDDLMGFQMELEKQLRGGAI